MTEQDFLRQRGKIIQDITSELIDMQTGELVSQERHTVRSASTEPDYIKIYYRVMMAAEGISEVPLNFVLALSAQLGYADKNKPLLFYNNKTVRREIADYCGITDSMVNKYLKRCLICGILFRTSDRGTYEVNPWLISKGRWEHIRELQANFRFIEGHWERVITSEGGEDAAQD